MSNPEEPICYLVPEYKAKRNRLDRVLAITQCQRELIAKQIMNPSLEMRKLTHVKLRVISDQLSLLVLRDSFLAVNLCAQNLLDLEYKKHPLLELTFDDGNQKKFFDLRPFIPIVLRY